MIEIPLATREAGISSRKAISTATVCGVTPGAAVLPDATRYPDWVHDEAASVQSVPVHSEYGFGNRGIPMPREQLGGETN